MRFPRKHLLRRSILSAALLIAPAAATAADHPGLLQGLITGRTATPAQRASTDSTTVHAELQKLFHPQQHQAVQHQTVMTGAAVQQVQHSTSEESPGWLQQLFSGRSMSERRATRLQGRAERMNSNMMNQAPSVPKPPPIDYAMQQRSRSASVSTFPAGYSKHVSQPPGVPPVGVPPAGMLPDGRVGLKPEPVNKFVSPFIDDEALERKSVALDLDSLIDRPADRSEAMPITTEGDVVKRLIELPIPLKPPTRDPLLEDHTVTLPAADEVPDSVADSEAMESQQTVAQDMTQPDEAESDSNNHIVELPVVDNETADQPADKSASESTDEEETEIVVVQTEKTATIVEESSSAITAESPEDAPQSDDDSESLETAARLSIQEKNARRQQQRYLILSRAGRTGFKGFCPVALRQTQTLRDSSPNHTARFGLKTYQFSSEEARLQFEADPARYAPAAGGSDVVVLSNTGEETEGSLDFCLWYRDRLYLFRSRETQAMFSSDPARFANEY